MTLTPTTIIKPDEHGFHVYQYNKIVYGAMTNEEAFKCLKALISSIKFALDGLHKLGLSHNDVRLPNICFNEQYNSILIDIQAFHPLYSAANSCMYEIHHLVHRICVGEARGKLCDYMQLGWLAVYVIN